MTFSSLLRARVLVSAACVALLAASPATSQVSNPSEPLLSRGPWRDAFVLRGPGAQIGASVRNLTPAEAEQHRKSILSVRGGVVVYELLAESPASRAGLIKGDRIAVFDGQRVRDAAHFSQLVEETPPGWRVNITVVRDGRVRELTITPTL